MTSFVQPADWWEWWKPLERPEDHYPRVEADDFGECLFRLKVSRFLAESRGYVVFRNRRDTQSVIVVRARLVGSATPGILQVVTSRADLPAVKVERVIERLRPLLAGSPAQIESMQRKTIMLDGLTIGCAIADGAMVSWCPDILLPESAWLDVTITQFSDSLEEAFGDAT